MPLMDQWFLRSAGELPYVPYVPYLQVYILGMHVLSVTADEPHEMAKLQQ